MKIHIFFKKFSISSIPRYILLNDKGAILNSLMPHPSNKIEIEVILNSYIKSQKII
jgi:hypothetical protein